MVVTWVTMQSTHASVVKYGVEELSRMARGTQDVFTDGGQEKRVMYIHRVTVTGLQPGIKYSEYKILFHFFSFCLNHKNNF